MLQPCGLQTGKLAEEQPGAIGQLPEETPNSTEPLPEPIGWEEWTPGQVLVVAETGEVVEFRELDFRSDGSILVLVNSRGGNCQIHSLAALVDGTEAALAELADCQTIDRMAMIRKRFPSEILREATGRLPADQREMIRRWVMLLNERDRGKPAKNRT